MDEPTEDKFSATEFSNEFNKRLEERFLNFAKELRGKMSNPLELAVLEAIPLDVLKATFVAGGNLGLKVTMELIQEGKL